MTVLDPPRHPYVDRALRLAAHWCAGRTIDDAPALTHAVAVAKVLVDHVPDVDPVLVAAALMHDAEEFADVTNDLLDSVLMHGIVDGVAPIVRALAAQHRAMDAGQPPDCTNAHVVLVAAADKVVALRSLKRRANASGDAAAFWRARSRLRDLLPYFRRWCDLAQPLLPASLTAELRAALRVVADDIAAADVLNTTMQKEPV